MLAFILCQVAHMGFLRLLYKDSGKSQATGPKTLLACLWGPGPCNYIVGLLYTCA